MGSPPLDLVLVAQYALYVSLVKLLPVPVLDWLIEEALRKRLTRLQLRGFDLELPRRDIRLLASGDAGGCLGLMWSIVAWPFRRFLWYLLWVLLLKAMIDTFSDVVARSILVHEAAELGLLHDHSAVEVRAAIQRARRGVNTRPIERAFSIVFRSLWGQLFRRHGIETLSEALARAIYLPETHEKLRRQLQEEAAVGIALYDDEE
ncbi:MAG: hypothetical protein AB8H79_16160 [Myxococcota bacterium]